MNEHVQRRIVDPSIVHRKRYRPGLRQGPEHVSRQRNVINFLQTARYDLSKELRAKLTVDS